MSQERLSTPGDGEPDAVSGDHAQPRTPAGDAVTELVLPVFALNAELLLVAETLTRPVGLTPAWWQVLAAAGREPSPVAEIARRVGLGLTRQSVQRVADLLVEGGWAAYRDNPAHRRARLLEPTAKGHAALRRLAESQREWADAVGAEMGEEELRHVLGVLRRVAASSRTHREPVIEG